ncbi:MAG: hypothetical protein JWL62_819, partial [Hyphomicrobiales bacterium]|nr:hypothetical protein [Hyphomicrobiales bacterium]
PATSIGVTGGLLFFGMAMIPILAGASNDSLDERGLSDGHHVWLEINRPARIYSLEQPDLGTDPPVYAAMRDRGGPGRSDTLTFGTFLGNDRPWLHVNLESATLSAPGSTFATAIRHQATQAGMAILGLADPSILATRFGKFQVADVLLVPDGSAKAGLDCLAFQLTGKNSVLHIEGLACESPDRHIDRAALSCMIDRIDLVSAQRERGAGAFFAKAEAGRRRECGRPGALRSALIPIVKPERRGRIVAFK